VVSETEVQIRLEQAGDVDALELHHPKDRQANSIFSSQVEQDSFSGMRSISTAPAFLQMSPRYNEVLAGSDEMNVHRSQDLPFQG
jgi:hypothetical protein